MIIITGASRGIGRYLMQQFLLDHKEVFGLYNLTKPKEGSGLFFKTDISNPDEVRSLVESTRDSLNHLVLINCAGANYNAYAHKADPKRWANLISINLIGTFNMINVLLPIMREQRYGRIINLSSVVAQIGIPGTSAYAASKSGMWGLTKAIAIENASRGITINNLNLGYFAIGMTEEFPVEMKEIIRAKIPFNKFGSPNEVFKAVNFLIDSEYITGTSIDINGGLF